MSITIALAGNPNSGKTTLFNKLTGANQRVGNWPGVTIDRKTGKVRGHDIEVVDLPGIYSLSPYSPEEIVSRDFLIEDSPDAIVNIVDATNLERNLFLTLQILDLGIPTVIALNMMDQIEKFGDTVDVDKLSKDLGCPIVPISAVNSRGITELIGKVEEIAEQKSIPKPVLYDGDTEAAIAKAKELFEGKVEEEHIRFYAVKLIENDKIIEEKYPDENEKIRDAVKDLESKKDDEIDSIVADARYGRIAEIVGETVKKAQRDPRGTITDRVDRIVTHRIWGLPIFIVILAIIFFGVIGFSTGDLEGDFEIVGIGTWCTDWLNDFLTGDEVDWSVYLAVSGWCEDAGVSDALASLLCDGIIGGVGAVLGFLPQMLILFFVLCVLEDIGYMARIAFVMDRIFRHFNLSGKSLIPLLVGTGCGVPGIMASRTIESERDRRITAMTVTFIPCGAKLPVIALLTSAVFGGNGLVAVFIYCLGVVCVLISGIILKKFRRLSGAATPFIMELPPYHVPSAVNLIKGTLDRGWAFCKKAGTIIVLASILIWFLSSFDFGLTYLSEEEMNDSILAAIGGAIHYIFVPLGWTQLDDEWWKLTVATITGLIAKEDVVGTMGVLGIDETLGDLVSKAGGLSFLTFSMICVPCFAACGAMHRELGTWKATLCAAIYQCLLAYCVSLILYGFLGCIGGWNVIDGTDYGAPIGSTIAAVVVVAILVYLLWAKDPFHQLEGRDEYEEEETLI